jgi:nickel-type superoxide dismutase maturation protease
MVPTLEPGDWLLVDTDAFQDRTPKPGELVLVPDPRDRSRLLVKRTAAVSADGRHVSLAGDSPEGSTDSRAFGPVETDHVQGRPWFRYWPLRRCGRVE